MYAGAVAAGGFGIYDETAGAYRMAIDASGNVAINSTTFSTGLTVNGAIAIADAMTAPSTVASYAQIYVDVADGDLKVKFGDGTVKTIATNP